MNNLGEEAKEDMRSICYVFIFIVIALLTTLGCASKSPLISAASVGNYSTMERLVKDGSNVNEIDKNGATPLIHAVWSGNIETVRTLISMGADVNKRDNSGANAFSYATYYGYHNIAKLLFHANHAMKKEGIQGAQQVCREFHDDSIAKDGHAYDGHLNYRFLNPTINFKGNKTLSITVLDLRSYILSKEKGAAYVGLFKERGLVRPYFYDISTLSGKPLADDFSFCISFALRNAGFIIKTDFGQNNSNFINDKSEKKSSSPERRVSLEIKEWLTDTYSATGLYYDVTLKISDMNSNLLAATQAKGEDNIIRESERTMYEKVPTATEAILSKILNQSEIQSALKD